MTNLFIKLVNALHVTTLMITELVMRLLQELEQANAPALLGMKI
jgi:hypothetical protein